MEEKLLLITSGKGPAECERTVWLLTEKIRKAAAKEQLGAETIGLVPGKERNTLYSALIRIKGKSASLFCAEWTGTVQWIGQSPFRKNHKRRNWFAGIAAYDVTALPVWNERDVSYQSTRSSGPGGQHVNTTETAVRATHVPSGISVIASDERSQLMNKNAAKERLRNRLLGVYLARLNVQQRSQWLEHHQLERGNAVKVFREPLE
jgi:peptide chain release factor